MKTESIQCDDLISRKAAIDALWKAEKELPYYDSAQVAVNVIKDMPSAQQEVRPIDYQDCSNAMLKMWMDNVVTDGEYNRIMDKLNAYWGKKDE